MLTIHAASSAADVKKYFDVADYYSEGQETIGRWSGSLAARLGLSGQVDKASFERLCDNLHPVTGEQLTLSTKDNRRVGYDFTFSAPKSFSIVEAMADEPVRQRLLAAFGDVAPAALVGCGDSLMTADDWTNARTRYRQLLDQHPADRLTARARDGINRATQAIELANVRSLLVQDGAEDDTQPAYCSKPAKYSGAAPYGKGTNRALFFGNDTYTDKLPSSWRTTDPAHAVLVICAGDEDYGTAVQTCPYQSETSPYSPTNVTFRKIAIPVKVYELRTGKRVAKRKIQISGASCPRRISYTTYGPLDTGPPTEQYVKASTADVRAAFQPLIKR